MYVKIEITGEIELATGMHIGGSASFSAIGAIDSPVIRDVESDLPMIPGSSLKGKLRTLLAKKYNDGLPKPHNEDAENILRLFGSSEKEKIKRSRLIFSDMIMSNMEDLRETRDRLNGQSAGQSFRYPSFMMRRRKTKSRRILHCLQKG